MLANNPKRNLVFTDLVDVPVCAGDQQCVLLERNKIKGLDNFSVSLIDTYNGFLVVTENVAKEFKDYEEACCYMYDEILDGKLKEIEND